MKFKKKCNTYEVGDKVSDLMGVWKMYQETIRYLQK